MIKSKNSWGIVVFTTIITMTITACSAYQVNETIGDYRISFDAPNDTNTIAKLWGGQAKYGLGHPLGAGPDDASKYYVLMTGNLSNFSTIIQGVVILDYENPINTSSNNSVVEIIGGASLIGNSTGAQIETTRSIVDGHNATISEIHNSTAGTEVAYSALYWINEVDGMATKGVVIMSTYPWEEGTEALINTIHVEEETN